MFDKNTMVIIPTYRGENYLFTVKEALDYIVDNNHIYFLDDLIMHNIPIRDEIRQNGISKVATTLLQYTKKSKIFEARLENIVEHFNNKQLADFDIQILPITAKLKLYGKLVNYEELTEHVEITKQIGGDFSEGKENDMHVAVLYDRYPCFDSYDYANERRCYMNLFVSDHRFTKDDCEEIEKQPCMMDCCYVNEKLDAKYLPAIYRDGDSRFMYVATTKNNPQPTPEELAKSL